MVTPRTAGVPRRVARTSARQAVSSQQDGRVLESGAVHREGPLRTR
ncbi:hypothetical protein [Nonomuraea jabiensis]